MNIVMGIILLVAAVFLVVAVLMQSGKSHNLSGSIAGGAETFFGKTKGKAIDKMLSKVTTIVAIVFTLLVIVMYVLQPVEYLDSDKWFKDNFDSTEIFSSETTVADEADENLAQVPADDDIDSSDEDIFETEAEEVPAE
jgi:protein translocase, SecG subunit